MSPTESDGGLCGLLVGAIALALTACGGSGSDASTTPIDPAASSSSISSSTVATTGTVQLLPSDGSSDWATIGVKVLGIALTPQGGGSPVVVYSSATTSPKEASTPVSSPV